MRLEVLWSEELRQFCSNHEIKLEMDVHFGITGGTWESIDIFPIEGSSGERFDAYTILDLGQSDEKLRNEIRNVLQNISGSRNE